MTTEQFIKRLRAFMHPGPLAQDIMLEAAAKLESMQWELTQAISERIPHDYGILKEEAQEMRKQRDEARAEVERLKSQLQEAYHAVSRQIACQARPEPSRLEIAAMFMTSIYARQYGTPCEHHALQRADALIAAAREGK
jgi:hypothetical protein